MHTLIQNQSLSVITYDPLEVCGGVCICRDPALCLYFLILLCSGRFWASTFRQWRGEEGPTLNVAFVTATDESYTLCL